MIYLDHNATTPLLPEVAQEMAECLALPANPNSQHAAGRRARRLLEDARESIGRILGAEVSGQHPDRVIFTSGGTEANNLALLGLAGSRPARLIISAIEHASVTGPAERLAEAGWEVVRLAPDGDGVVPVERLAESLSDDTRLVSVMLANNETGVVQPVAAMTELAHRRGALVHTDAAQAIAKMPVSFRQLGVDTMSIAAHKFHGPVGIGALIVRHGLSLAPLLSGGFQEDGLRPGTEPLALAVGMCRALEAWQREVAERQERLRRLRDRLELALKTGYPALVVNGQGAERLPHVANVAFVGLNRQALLIALDQAGIAASSGSACKSGSSEPSPVLLAMGVPKPVADSSLRFSLGATTTEAQIDDAAERILQVCSRMTGQHSAA
jgi:cysteine desulfurase